VDVVGEVEAVTCVDRDDHAGPARFNKNMLEMWGRGYIAR
jgi:hypothetical protein